MSGPLRVLFIEDQPDQSTMFAMLLGNCGCHVVTAPNGSEGISLALFLKPHLIFTDLRMPDMSGIDVAKAILEKCHPTPMLVALTGFGEEHRAAWQEIGLEDYLVKPANPESFLAILLKAQQWREVMEADHPHMPNQPTPQ
jgi:two-component system, OmpR family, alkaline phosphatase synthesis response regulator PhoP